MTLYFLRHGQSQANAGGVYAGPDSPLTELGREQAKAAGHKIAGLGISAVISSDLRRAAETAHIAAVTAGLNPGAVTTDPRLRELGVGDLMNTPDRNLGGYLEHQAHPHGDAGVEPVTHASSRLQSLIKDLKKHTGNILLVSHDGIAQLLYAELAGESGQLARRFSLPNGGLIELPPLNPKQESKL